MEQRSEEWFEARRGSVTGSRVADVMSKGRGKAESAGVKNYRAQLVAERLTGMIEETFCSQDMQNGIDREETARKCYEFETGNTVELVGYVKHPSVESSGCSPDGLTLDGLVEIKCPKTATHIDYMLSKEVPDKYNKQIQWQMACTGTGWCDFVSYGPDMPESLQLLIVRVTRDNEMIAEIEKTVIGFLQSVEMMVTELESCAN